MFDGEVPKLHDAIGTLATLAPPGFGMALEAGAVIAKAHEEGREIEASDLLEIGGGPWLKDTF